MKPYYDHAGITIFCADCLTILPELENIGAIVTDPPYSSGEVEHSEGTGCRRRSLNTWRLALFYPERRQWIGGVIIPVTRQVIDKGVHSEETRTDTYYPDALSKASGATVAEIQALIASVQYAYARLVEIATAAGKRTGGKEAA